MIQARQSGTGTRIGTFNTPAGVQHVNCGNPGPQATVRTDIESDIITVYYCYISKVTHTNSTSKPSIVVNWTAPSNSGTVKF